MWIESHQSLRNHPKIKKAARLANINEFEMIGRVHCLWWWALDYAPDGDVTKYSSDDIESAVDWDGTPGAFYNALLQCGFNGHCGLLEDIDGVISIHDWHEYGGRLLEKREANAERMREKRALHVQNTTIARTGATEQTEQTEQHNTYKEALKRLEARFSESTGIPLPPRNTEKEKKASATSWWNPLGISIYKNLCQENIDIALQVVDLTVKKMRSAKPEPLTVTSPRSIEKVAAAVYAEKFGRNGNSQTDSMRGYQKV